MLLLTHRTLALAPRRADNAAHLALRAVLHPVLAWPLCGRASLPLHALLCRIHIIQQLGLGLGLDLGSDLGLSLSLASASQRLASASARSRARSGRHIVVIDP